MGTFYWGGFASGFVVAIIADVVLWMIRRLP